MARCFDSRIVTSCKKAMRAESGVETLSVPRAPFGTDESAAPSSLYLGEWNNRWTLRSRAASCLALDMSNRRRRTEQHHQTMSLRRGYRNRDVGALSRPVYG